MLVGWVGFMVYQPLLVTKTPSPIFIENNQFLFQTIQFSMSTQFNCQKTFLFQNIQFSQTVLIQLIQFSISIDFVQTHFKFHDSFMLNNLV